MFKVLASGDPISAEKKFGQDFAFTPFAKLIFSANLPPLPPEGIQDEDAFYKRWYVVSFNLRKTSLFSGKEIEIDRELISKLTSEQETFRLAISGCQGRHTQRLLAKGRFTKVSDIETIMNEYEKKADPVKAWVLTNCALSPGYETEKDKPLEADFAPSCQTRKLPILNRVHLGRRLTTSSKREEWKDGT